MRSISLLGLVAVISVINHVAADLQEPSKKLATARTEYENVLEKAKSVYDEAIKIAGEEYQEKLKLILEEETKAGDLDAALSIRDEIKSVDEGEIPISAQKVKTPADLRRFLIGTRWGNESDPLLFHADGTIRAPSWDQRGLVTKWEAVDRRTVVYTLTKGRDQDLVAVTKFNEAIDNCQGIGFTHLEKWKFDRITRDKKKK